MPSTHGDHRSDTRIDSAPNPATWYRTGGPVTMALRLLGNGFAGTIMVLLLIEHLPPFVARPSLVLGKV